MLAAEGVITQGPVLCNHAAMCCRAMWQLPCKTDNYAAVHLER